MKVSEVLNDRDLICRILTQNLRQYGNLEPAGFVARPMHGTGEELCMMSRANYLRVAAYLQETSPQNPHFISQLEAESLHLTIKPDARPVYLESWTRDNADYSARLVPYYNIEDTIGRHKRIEAFRHNIPQHDTAEYLHRAGMVLGMSDSPQNGNAVRQYAEAFALEEGLNDIEAKAFSLLILKNSSLQLLSRLLIAPSQCLQSLEQCA